MTEHVNYKTAPIGTVASEEFTTLVRNDKGWYWLEGNLQEGDTHEVPREVVHEFKLGEVITPETLAWLPPGSEIAPENQRQRYAMTRDTEGWVWANGTSGRHSTVRVTEWVAADKYTLTKFPGLEVEDPYVVGATLEGLEAYENAPVGTVVELKTPVTQRVKVADNDWRRLNKPQIPCSGALSIKRTIVDLLAPWEVDLLVATPVVDPRVKGTVSLDYTYNAEKGTVYSYSTTHRDFGRVVELPNGRFLAVPNRAPREFETAQEAVEWLI